MNNSGRHRLSVAKELAAWNAELPALRARVANALAKTSVPGSKKIELETTVRRINMLINAISAKSDADENARFFYDRLVIRVNRCRELLAALKAALDGVANLPSDAVRQRPAQRDWRTSSHVDRPKN
jgi:hypothetical protein